MKLYKEVKVLPAFLMVITASVVGCKMGPEDSPPQSVVDVVAESGSSASSSAGGASSSSSSSSENYPPTPLFEHSGFEFCCGGFGTYESHGFAASGVVQMLDGGQWAADIDGAEGERVFASFGDGFDDEGDSTAEWKGWELTGSLTSPEFEIPARYINFLAGGGTNPFDSERPTAIVLKVGGDIVRHAVGNGQEATLSLVTWDVQDYIGQMARIEIIDGHDDAGDDGSLPMILADRFEASSSAETTPSGVTEGGEVELVFTDAPETEGFSLFSRPGSEQNIAGFEFCCGGFDTYQEHSFGVTGDFVYLDGGEWAEAFDGRQGERVFASFGNAFDQDEGNFFLGWNARGRLSSPEFVIGSNFINFLVGGGDNHYNEPNATAVVLRVEGEVVRHASGANVENALAWVSWDVSALKGHKGVIEIIDMHPDDGSDEALPYILADEFRAADKVAVEPAEDSVVTNTLPGPLASRLKVGDPNPYYEDGTFYLYYLHDDGRHPWYLSQTDDLVNFSSAYEVLSPGSESDSQDYWTGSGSVIKDDLGQYRMYYTGHNQTIQPVEAVMLATADSPDSDSWTKQAEATFTGGDGYSDFDFRDPWVFWNESDNAYWMLLTSRYNSQAAIALYTSPDLDSWTAEAPLYQESSDLNLEVPDLLQLSGDEYLIYSDQRDASRQVRHLVPDGAGDWEYPEFDALDGRGYYAGRSAGPESNKLLFGWVPHKLGSVDSGRFRWGGDLVTHQLYKTDAEGLAVALPDALRAELSTEVALNVVAQTDGAAVSDGNAVLTGESSVLFEAVNQLTRMTLSIDQFPVDASFGVDFKDAGTGRMARVAFDASANEVSFSLDGSRGNPLDPIVSAPLTEGEPIELEILLDPVLEYGVVYIDDFRALTFRFYELEQYDIGLYSESGLNVSSIKRFE
ncbi:sucrose-6-phosphate hydrolase SacC (GH32 family) [Marinimicrobium koreense]|uniref:beta-fructofuranosidase n=1 Tax=Marinimicrobium koreense TaxID=306545 RepID=A0A3N1NXL9_9GAMM|nr:hypothetical protein [Marinimicrobium koreense]ROQ20955.1 sucrose-6-phosphate hydrolase SacC (GH32 family) [Marinimicrobium koreense]